MNAIHAHRRGLSPIAGMVLLIAGAVTALTGCGNPVGTPCEIVGSGFTASHDCATKCLSRWNVTCPDGDRIMPKVCAGASACEPGECPGGQLCYHFDDPFDKRSYCVPDTVCGEPLTGEAASDWEITAYDRAAASRAASEERQRRREQAIRDGQPETASDAAPLDGT